MYEHHRSTKADSLEPSAYDSFTTKETLGLPNCIALDLTCKIMGATIRQWSPKARDAVTRPQWLWEQEKEIRMLRLAPHVPDQYKTSYQKLERIFKLADSRHVNLWTPNRKQWIEARSILGTPLAILRGNQSDVWTAKNPGYNHMDRCSACTCYYDAGFETEEKFSTFRGKNYPKDNHTACAECVVYSLHLEGANDIPTQPTTAQS